MSNSEQAKEINDTVWCRLGPSKIHGVGVIALRDIKAGQKLYCFPRALGKFYSIPYDKLGMLLPEIRGLVLERWASIINGSHFTSPNDDAWLILFMNHSDNPNYDPKTDCALKDIAKGEEITEDYRPMKNAEKIFDFL